MSKFLSLEINYPYIKIIDAVKERELFTIRKFITLNVSVGEDDYLEKADIVRTAIENALINNKIKTEKAILSLNSNSILIRKVVLPYLKNKNQIKSMIGYELEQITSANLSQYIIYFKVVEMFYDNEIKKAKYIVYGIPIKMYKYYIELSKKLNLKLLAMDLSSNFIEVLGSKNFSINERLLDMNRVTLFVNICTDNIVFSVINNCYNDYSRVVYINTDYKEHESIDRAAEEENIYGTMNIKQSEEYVDKCIEEVTKIIRYYSSVNKGKERNVNKIYIYGSSDGSSELISHLLSDNNPDVEVINNISFKSINLDSKSNEYINCLLALYSYKNNSNNFLTDSQRLCLLKFNLRVISIAAVFILILYFSYIYMINSFSNISVKNKTDKMKSYINNNENIILNDEIEKVKKDLLFFESYKKKAENVKELINDNDNVKSVIFKEIAKATPFHTKTNYLSIENNTAQLHCYSDSLDDIMHYLFNLRNIDFITDVYIPSIDFNQNSVSCYSYLIICKLKDVF